MKEELIEIRNNLLSALEQNDVILAKMYINKLDTLLHKQIKCYCGHTTYCECGPEELKQETLEEASWKFNPLKKLDGEFLRAAFVAGAKSDAAKEYWYKIFKSE